jgi:hypothetical protein
MKNRKKTPPVTSSTIDLLNLQDNIDTTDDFSDAYIENCKRFELHVDPSVVIAFKTSWAILQPTKTFSEGSMLPLIEILRDSQTISKVNLSNVAMHDSRYFLS